MRCEKKDSKFSLRGGRPNPMTSAQDVLHCAPDSLGEEILAGLFYLLFSTPLQNIGTMLIVAFGSPADGMLVAFELCNRSRIRIVRSRVREQDIFSVASGFGVRYCFIKFVRLCQREQAYRGR